VPSAQETACQLPSCVQFARQVPHAMWRRRRMCRWAAASLTGMVVILAGSSWPGATVRAGTTLHTVAGLGSGGSWLIAMPRPSASCSRRSASLPSLAGAHRELGRVGTRVGARRRRAARSSVHSPSVRRARRSSGCSGGSRGLRLRPRVPVNRQASSVNRSRLNPRSRHRLISSRHARNTSSPWVAGSAMSPCSPAHSLSVKMGRPPASV
jgi:hypothetical protein